MGIQCGDHLSLFVFRAEMMKVGICLKSAREFCNNTIVELGTERRADM